MIQWKSDISMTILQYHGASILIFWTISSTKGTAGTVGEDIFHHMSVRKLYHFIYETAGAVEIKKKWSYGAIISFGQSTAFYFKWESLLQTQL